jgi:hypothetical protein
VCGVPSALASCFFLFRAVGAGVETMSGLTSCSLMGMSPIGP